MAITAGVVKELRERTGAGMMDCKNAHTETDGDIEKAIEFLREKGLASAAKKSGRIAAEGSVNSFITEDGKHGVLAEVNCETDFVAKTDEFISIVSEFAEVAALSGDEVEVDAVLVRPHGEATFGDKVTAMVAKIGEKISPRRFHRLRAKKAGIVESYIHMGGKIGVMLVLEADVECDTAKLKTLARDVSMHIAAVNPMYIDVKDVDPEVLEKEKKILTAQALEEGKPANIVEKMVIGRIKKYEKEICLMEQPYGKDPDVTIAQLLKNASKDLGTDVWVEEFIRYEMGEGLEKREDDFVGEVMKQVGQ